MTIDRRRFVAVAACFPLLGPRVSDAQPAGPVRRVGLLMPSDGTTGIQVDGRATLVATLRDLGWIDGKTVGLETRWAGVDPDRQRQVAAEFKALPVALIVTVGTTAIRAARDGAPGVPIVMVNAGDPVASGLVASLARPGGNLTGTSAAGEEVLSKHVELLATAVPRLGKVGVMMNSANPANNVLFDAMAARAKTLSLRIDRIDVATENDFEAAVARARGGALIVVADPMFYLHRERITALAIRHQVPSIYGPSDYVVAGGLMSYLSSNEWHWRTAAGVVDKILKGAKAADIPVAQPTEFKLTVNLKTAKALGIALPPSLLVRADEKIQ